MGFNSTNEYYGYFDPYSYYSYDDSANWFYPDTSGEWSGNFMNWVSMHRIDIAHKVLTGGPYDNSTVQGTYKVSRTDEGSDHRGKYHVIDASVAVIDLNGELKYPVPPTYRSKIGFVQVNSSDNIFIYPVDTVEGISPQRWNIKTTQVGSYTLKVVSEKIWRT